MAKEQPSPICGGYTLVAWFDRAAARRVGVEIGQQKMSIEVSRKMRRRMGDSHCAQLRPSGIRTVTVPGVARPWGVTLLALFQALKAGILLLTGLLLHFSPETVLGPRSALYPLLYIAMRGKSSLISAALNGGGALLAVMLIFGLYLLYVAFGLWEMRPSARRAVMFTSGMTLVFYLKAVLFSGAVDGSLSGMDFFSPNVHNIHLLLFIDTAVFVYFMRGSTASQFRA